jgi:acrylyl-CoA reductase (NADPH)
MRAILVEKPGSNQTGAAQAVRLADVPEAMMGEGDVTVEISHSTLNYKDALAITGRSPVVRKFPMIPGIDLAGTVSRSGHPAWQPGDAVLANGWGLGETHPGGLAERARLPGDWLLRIPAPLDPRLAMAFGTAGYTAALCVLALERHGVAPADGEVLVTGAGGGVGSVAIALLKHRGFTVVASTGRTAEAPYLKALGAAEVVDRAELSGPVKALARERWAGVVDAVGGVTLANACAGTKYRGAVTACGLAGGMDFPATVAPFILRGVTLYGIDSARAPRPLREQAWARLAADVPPGALPAMTREIGLAEAIGAASELLDGRVRGRLVVDVRR